MAQPPVGDTSPPYMRPAPLALPTPDALGEPGETPVLMPLRLPAQPRPTVLPMLPTQVPTPAPAARSTPFSATPVSLPVMRPSPVPVPVGPLTPPPLGTPTFNTMSMQTDLKKKPSDDTTAEEERAFALTLDIPGNEELFRREGEGKLQERIREEFKKQGVTDPIEFPQVPVLSKTPFPGRSFSRQMATVEPNYVTHGRLYFEDRNHERYGWDFGPFQPLISAAAFYKDVLFFPHNYFSHPCDRWETNAGYCLPGDPVPYLMYPPQITWTGLAGQAGVIFLGYGIIP